MILLELARPVDLYDLVAGRFVVRRAKSGDRFRLGAGQAAVLVQVPPGAQVHLARHGFVTGDVVIDYHRMAIKR